MSITKANVNFETYLVSINDIYNSVVNNFTQLPMGEQYIKLIQDSKNTQC